MEKKDRSLKNTIAKVFNKINWILFRQSGRTKINPKVDVYIVSYPKSGRTWLRVILGKIICEQFKIDEKYLLNTIKLTLMAGCTTINWIHDGSGLGEGYHFRKFRTDKSIFSQKKIIFLYRDPHDVMVSSYFHATKRIQKFTKFQGNISEFIRSQGFGIEKLITFYNIWYVNRHIPKDFLLVKYEELHHDTLETIKKIINYINLKDIDEELIIKAINFGSFDNMKKIEYNQSLKSKIMVASKQDDNESYKVRKGKVGGYIDYLNQDDIDYIDRVITQMGCPFYQK